jgi:hypothetical protein
MKKILIIVALFFSLSGFSQIVLSELKAFPAAFGYGKSVTGGRGGQLYFVTNLNDSGTGSLRAALSATGSRVVVIKVEGRLQALSAMNFSSGSQGDVTIIGQTASGLGLEVTGQRFTFTNNGNIVMRHLTARNGAIAGFGSFGVREALSGKGAYVDHSTFTYGMDQSLDFVGRFNNQNWTAANNMIAESLEGHNTGSIMGTSGNGSENTGSFTVARNMWYNMTHRFPNPSGTGGKFEIYNNYIVNWQSRLSRANGPVKVDYYNNYGDSGNHAKTSSAPVNKWQPVSAEDFKTWTSLNFFKDWEQVIENDQRDLWVYYKTLGAQIENQPLSATYYSATRLNNGEQPTDGIWDALDVPDLVTNDVGHNRGTDSSGNPVFNRDALDASYISKSLTGTTEVNYRESPVWNYPTRSSGYTAFLDADSDGMADTFEDTHGLNKNSAADGLSVKTNWTFTGYTVTNNAGYSNREMYWAWLAGDFDYLLAAQNVVVGNVPIVTLTGSSTVNIQVGNAYTELGATYSDMEDGSGVAIVTGTVDNNTIGTYFKYYNYTDTDTNIAIQRVRTINVTAINPLFKPTRSKKFRLISSKIKMFLNNNRIY